MWFQECCLSPPEHPSRVCSSRSPSSVNIHSFLTLLNLFPFCAFHSIVLFLLPHLFSLSLITLCAPHLSLPPSPHLFPPPFGQQSLLYLWVTVCTVLVVLLFPLFSILPSHCSLLCLHSVHVILYKHLTTGEGITCPRLLYSLLA